MNNLFTILFFTLLASPFYSNAQNSTSSIYLDQDLEELEELIDMNLLEDDVYHLFAHGRPGELYLNNEWLSSKEIIEFLQARIIDKAGSNPFSHLNIYACDFGKGKKGARALKELQSIFPQGIAASTNKVGNSNLGGDWEMEVILGSPKNILQIPNWDKTLQITFSFTNNYTNTTTLANFNCAGYTTMDATLIFNSPPLTITFACPITSVSIPMMSLGESNIEMYSFDAVGAPETLSTTCTDVDIVGNTVTNNTGAGGTSGVDFYLTLSSTTPFTQIIVTKLSGTYAAGIMNTGSGYWTDPCITPTPCTTPSACSITGPNTLTTGASGSYSTAAPTPTGTSSSWSITPTTGVSLSSGIGTNTGNLSFANAGTYTLSFTHTNNSNPSSCNPSSSITCSTTITVSSSCSKFQQ